MKANPPRWRVLHVGKYFPPDAGGMETYLADLLPAQRAQGLDAHALVHGTPRADDPPWLTRVPTRGQLLYAPVAPGFRRALRQTIERLAPDVLHLHLPNTSALWCLGLSAARSLPWVVHWHADVVASRRRVLINLAYEAYRPLEQTVLERAECIVATSQPYLEASRPLRRWRDKCVVVPLGLDLARHTPAAAHAALAEEAGGVAVPQVSVAAPQQASSGAHPWLDGHLRLLSVGRLAHYKGFETLVRAVAALPGVQLVVAGDGELRASLQALVRSLCPPGAPARVTLAGAVSEADKHALLAACDLFCLASRERTEAFGLAVLEAMQHGKPCLVSELPGSGLPWLVRSSDAGRTVPPDDVAAWRTAIQAMGADADGRAAMGERGRQAAAGRFDIQASARGLAQVYRRACAADAPHAAPAMGRAGPAEARSDMPPGPRGDGPPDTPTDASPDATPQDTLIVIPARDEAATVGDVVTRLRESGWPHVLVVDDGSRDDTAAVAAAAGAKVMRPVLPLGAWGAMQTGLRHAVRRGYQRVVTLDADGQHEPACIPDLLAQARTHDVIIGAFPERGSPLRQFAWRYFRWLTGFGIEDLTSGFRCYNRRACELLAAEEATLLDYQDLGVLMMLRAAGMRIAEVPVAMYPRASGASRVYTSWLRVVRYMVESTLLCLARWHPRHYFR